MKEKDFLGCAFCDWRTPRWTRSKSGKTQHGGTRLEHHVTDKHSNAYLAAMHNVERTTEPLPEEDE